MLSVRGQEHIHHSMDTPLLPMWARMLWVAVLGVVAVSHLRHTTNPGQHRWWHAGHGVMAVGMIAMYLSMATPWVLRTSLVVFGALTVATSATAVLWWRREGVLNPLWVVAALDALAMAYMSLPGAVRNGTWDSITTAYWGLMALAWISGVWSALPLYRVPDPAAHSGSGMEVRAARVGLSGHVGVTVALSLAVMNGSMAYMLTAM